MRNACICHQKVKSHWVFKIRMMHCKVNLSHGGGSVSTRTVWCQSAIHVAYIDGQETFNDSVTCYIYFCITNF